MGRPIRVLIADDQHLMRSGILGILATAPDITVVGEAADGAEAIELARSLSPDVICMDVEMPVIDGLEATERIVASGSPSAVLILTTFDSDEYVFGALQAGASGFVLKNARPENLIGAVRTLAAGDALLAPEITRRVIARFHGRPEPSLEVPSETWGLTPREAEVIALVARGLSNDEIAAELTVGGTTVKTHVSHLLAKLGLRDRVQLTVFAFGHGLA